MPLQPMTQTTASCEDAEAVRSTPLAQERAPSGVALVIIDMFSSWPADDDGVFLQAALTIAPNIADLKRRCSETGVPVIYANDNAGHWRSDFRCTVDAARRAGGAAREIAELLAPTPQDYFVLKPKHSAFFATPLELLLRHLDVHRLILTGVSADQCVMATASDALMRDLQVDIVMDGVAAPTGTRVGAAVKHFQDVMQLVVQPASDIELGLAHDRSPSV